VIGTPTPKVLAHATSSPVSNLIAGEQIC